LEFDLRRDNKSRMSREIHVRFRESLGVRFPRATRLVVMARYIDRRIEGWVEETIESWMGLEQLLPTRLPCSTLS